MHDTEEGRLAKRILETLETGRGSIADAAVHVQDIDPVLVHAIVRSVREAHAGEDGTSFGVLKRLVELSAMAPTLQAKHDEGAKDPIVEWFDSTHDWREFRGRSPALIDLLVDKLES